MMGHRESVSLAISLPAVAIMMLGCDGELPVRPSVGSLAPASMDVSVTNQNDRPQTLDEAFTEIARQVPGFAGAYAAADGTPQVLLVDLAQQGKAMDAIERLVQHSVGQGRDHKPLIFRQVKYDFLQLIEWRNELLQTLFTDPEVVGLDIDEVGNRISVEVLTPSALQRTRAELLRRNIPSEVAMIDPDDGSDPGIDGADATPGLDSANAFGDGVTLRDQFSTIPAGVQISNGTYACTVGFNTYLSSTVRGIYNFDKFFVTAAHCTRTLGTVESTQFYQPNTTRLSIGTEFREPLWQGHSAAMPECPPGFICSLADAALVRYNGSVSWDGGTIARTQASPAGSLTVDLSAPRYRIVDSTETLLAGTVLYKVGRTTGLQSGSITSTCSARRITLDGVPTQYILLCQWVFGAKTQSGDSGGPVFFMKQSGFPGDVTLVGIVWGGEASYGVLSFYPYIAYELTDRDKQIACNGVDWCWPRLTVSARY